MKRLFSIFTILVILILSLGIGYSQSINGIQTYSFTAPSPQGVSNGSATGTAQGNNVTYYYWVITNYVRGKVQPTRPIQVNMVAPPSPGTPVTVRWTPITGAASYDVIRTTNSAVFPGNCTACRVGALGVTVNSIVDNGTLPNYTTFLAIPVAMSSFSLNNRDYTTPAIEVKGNNGVNMLVLQSGTTTPTTTITGPLAISGNLVFTSITGDIGNATSQQPRNIYFTNSVTGPPTGTFSLDGRINITSSAVGETLVSRDAGLFTGLRLEATAFGNLGAPADGIFVYCNDCTVAAPCAGGGTGALAKRLNGAWVCN